MQGLLAAVLLLSASGLEAQAFPPVTAEEWAVTEVAGEPNAGAVVLWKKAEFEMMDLRRQEVSSLLRVQVRLKVLSEQGLSEGEVEIPHSDFFRLQGFSGRTVFADGRVQPLPAEAKFRRKVSEAERIYVTAVAFPGVEKGAVVDYRYSLRFDSFLLLEPWVLSERLPVRLSEIVYHVPPSIQARTWARDPLQAGIETETSQGNQGTRLRVWAEDLPPLPADVYGLPASDLATRFLVLPTAYVDSDIHQRLMESWESTCRLVDEHHYAPARSRDRQARRRGKEIAAAAGGGGPREAAARIYRFVRDEIVTLPAAGVLLTEESTVDGVLERKAGDYAEKALLLQTMLEAAGIASRLVWAADRFQGLADLQLPNPGWFDTVVVAAEVGGERIYLDPSDRGLAFGQLPAGLEGSPALLFDRKKPEEITLPVAPFERNLRRAKVALTVDDGGRLTGLGTLELTGQQAHRSWAGESAAEPATWERGLAAAFADFEVGSVVVLAAAEGGEVRVTWTLAQHEEEVLGDEVTLAPSRPLGPEAQPFALPAELRRSPVLLPYAGRDELELTVKLPAGWSVEALPRPADHASAVGGFTAAAEIDAEGRTLTYRRRFDLPQREINSRDAYEQVRKLFAAVEASDAQAVALVRH